MDVEEFSRRWVDAWNRRDLDWIVGLYAHDVEFVSPRAEAVAGRAVIRGREALRAYWESALSSVSRIEFTLDHALLSGDEVAILYTNERDGQRRRGIELFVFGPDGRAVRGEAMYGATT